MRFKQRAILYIARERQKSFRLCLILFLLTVFLLLCSAIYQSTDASLKEVRQKISASFSLQNKDEVVLNDTLIERIISCGNIRAYDGENISTLYSTVNPPVPGYFSLEGEEEPAHLLRFSAHHQTELVQDFQSRDLELMSGRHIIPSDTHCALVSDEFALQNGLVVGDFVEAQYAPSVQREMLSVAEKTYVFEIVGIFSITEKGQSGKIQAESEMRSNCIFVDAASGHELNYKNLGDQYRQGISFWVDDPGSLTELIQQIRGIINEDQILLYVNDKAYRDSAEPLERILNLMRVLFVVLMIAGSGILSLVLYLWSKQRIREVGIYRSLGYSKCEIRLQFLAESTIVASAACLSALPASLLICLVSQIALPGLLSVIGVLFVVFVVSGFSILTATYPLLRMHPRQIFTQLS